MPFDRFVAYLLPFENVKNNIFWAIEGGRRFEGTSGQNRSEFSGHSCTLGLVRFRASCLKCRHQISQMASLFMALFPSINFVPMTGRTYIHRFVIFDAKPPYRWLRATRPFCFPAISNNSHFLRPSIWCEKVQMAVSMVLDGDDLLVTYGSLIDSSLSGRLQGVPGSARKQPIKQPTEMATSTMVLMGRFPLNGAFSDLNGAAFPGFRPKGPFYLFLGVAKRTK